MKRCKNFEPNILLDDHVAPGPLWLLLVLGWEELRVGTTVTLQMLVTGPAANHRPPFRLLTNHSPGQLRCSALQHYGRCSRHHAGQDTGYQDTNQTGITRIDTDSLPIIKVVHSFCFEAISSIYSLELAGNNSFSLSETDLIMESLVSSS